MNAEVKGDGSWWAPPIYATGKALEGLDPKHWVEVFAPDGTVRMPIVGQQRHAGKVDPQAISEALHFIPPEVVRWQVNLGDGVEIREEDGFYLLATDDNVPIVRFDETGLTPAFSMDGRLYLQGQIWYEDKWLDVDAGYEDDIVTPREEMNIHYFGWYPSIKTWGIAPSREVISPENVQELVEIARLGKSIAKDITWTDDGKEIAVLSSSGVHRHDSDTLQVLQSPNNCTGMIVSRNGNRVFERKGNEIVLFRVDKDCQEYILESDADTSQFRIYEFSHDEKMLALGESRWDHSALEYR